MQMPTEHFVLARSRPIRTAGIGALIAAIMTLPGLGTGTLWDNSETAYGEIAREILLTHDAVVMHLNGDAWFIQPPLYFWLGALAAKLFGVTTFALRIPSALAAIGAAAATAYFTARVASDRAGVLAAMLLSTALMQAVIGRLAIMDALLDTAVTCAIFLWYRALCGGPGRSGAWVLGWAALALGTLAKGPVAPVVALAVAGVWFALERLRSRGGRPLVTSPSLGAHLAGLAVFAAIVAPWTALEFARTGPSAFAELVGHYTIGRYLQPIENQSGPWWYYVPVVILGFFPWIAYLGPAVRTAVATPDAAARADGSSESAATLGRLALVWTVVPLVFFSFAKTKLPNYVALELPALSVLVAFWFESRAFSTSRRTALAWTAVVPVAFLALLVGMFAFTSSNRLGPAFATMTPDLYVFIGVNLLGSLAGFAFFLRAGTARLAPFALATSTIVAWLFVALVGEPHAERFKPVPKLAQVIDRERRPGDTVAIQGVAGGNALLFYTEPRVDALAPFDQTPDTAAADPHRAICDGTRAFVIGSKKRPPLDPTFGRNRHEVASEANDVLLLYDGPPCSGGPASSK